MPNRRKKFAHEVGKVANQRTDSVVFPTTAIHLSVTCPASNHHVFRSRNCNEDKSFETDFENYLRAEQKELGGNNDYHGVIGRRWRLVE